MTLFVAALGFVALVAFVTGAVVLSSRSRAAKLERFHHEAAAVGFARSPAPGTAGRLHAVGSYRGVPTILGFYPGDGNAESVATRTGVRITMNVEASDPSIESSQASRLAPGSLAAQAVEATWAHGWTGPIAHTWLPLTADRHAIRDALDRVLAAR